MDKIDEKRIVCPNCDEPMEPGDTCHNPDCRYEDPANRQDQDNNDG